MRLRYECVARKGLENGTDRFDEGLTHPRYECVARKGGWGWVYAMLTRGLRTLAINVSPARGWGV